MDESEKKEVQSICWKTVFIAVALILIGAVLGHLMTVQCYNKCATGRYGSGYCMRSCWDQGGMVGKCWREKKACGTQKSRGCREAQGKCQSGCTCPKCSKKTTCLPESKKAACPMTVKAADESEK